MTPAPLRILTPRRGSDGYDRRFRGFQSGGNDGSADDAHGGRFGIRDTCDSSIRPITARRDDPFRVDIGRMQVRGMPSFGGHIPASL